MASRLSFEERAEQGLVLFDGAMGTMIHSYELGEADYDQKLGCSEILNVTRPDVIQAIHEAYYAAGSDVVETNSFGSNTIVLAEYNIPERAREISRLAAEIARKAADKWSDPANCPGGASAAKPRFVAGSVGPGTKLISLGQTDWVTMYASYKEQVAGLLEGGVDLFLVETCQDLLQIKCALSAITDVMNELGRKVPVVVTVTVETTGTLLVGSDVSSVMAVLEPFKLFALGMNCATGPADMRPYIKQFSAAWGGKLLVQPNAGLPQNVNGQLMYTLSVEDYVDVMSSFIRDEGVGLVGGCCGTNPNFIGALNTEIPKLRAAQRTPENEPSVASIFSTQTMHQNPPAFYVGERTNTNGSKQFRELLLAEDYDGLLEVAREQAATGVHALDLCVAYTGRDEVRDMKETLKRIVTQIDLPLVIDSTEVPVLEAALQMYGGRAIINSINLEDGEARADRICLLAKRYGAALIALTIDERGMAREPAEKLAIAKRIYSIAVGRHGLKPEDLIFDPLTFTLGAGDETLRDSALATMEGIRLIKKELPGVMTILGLSNVSFGLSPVSRKVLNSVFLHECIQSGLDMAIVNLKHIVPLAQIEAADLEAAYRLLNNEWRKGDASLGEAAATGKDPLFAYIEHFQARSGQGDAGESAEAAADAPVQERLSQKIVKGSKSKLKETLLEALEGDASRGIMPRSAIGIINDVLIPAMKVVGELFGSGKMQLPFVLQSAEVMKAAVDVLQPFMEKKDSEEQVSIVLATVRGDVHDIGKNLVDIILSNNGYKVYNLGIKCEIDTMVQKAREVKAHAIGMSGLLVKSTIIMKENLEELTRRELKIPVLLGGAALTPSYVYDVCTDIAPGPLVYCSDAFEGLKAMNLIKEGKLPEYLAEEAEKRRKRSAAARPVVAPKAEPIVIDRNVAVPKAPFLGVRVVPRVDLETVYSYLTEEVLFRGRWGYRRGNMSKDEYEAMIRDQVRPEFEALKAASKKAGLINPAVSYGYWECNAAGQDVIMYDPEFPGERREIARFSFPRQAEVPNQCIADYFYPVESGVTDIIALQVTTVGAKAADHSQALYDSNSYKDYLLFHGLSVECAEALAEYWHLIVRQELGITEEDGSGIQDFVVQKYRGSRYSFGYPACPDLKQNRILCELSQSHLVGVTVSEEEQMVPEQTTSAFVVHHHQAKYFNA